MVVRVFSSIFAITQRIEMYLYDAPMFISLLGFGIGMIFVSFHVCVMMLLFSDNVIHVGEICESKRSYGMPDVDFIMPCGSLVFALFIAS